MGVKKILYIEDEADLRDGIVEFLRSEDFEVIEAGNGAQGVEAFYNVRPDIVLCDIKTPSMSGFEVLERINHDSSVTQPLCPFVFLTACDDLDHRLTGKGLGCDDYLVKPVNFDVLLTTLHSRLRLWERMKQAGEKKLNRFRHEMLSVLTNQLKNPMHAVIGYADMMDHNDPVSIEKCKAEIGGVAKKNISMIQNIMDSIMLAVEGQPLNIRSLSLKNVIWEALVFVKGYDHVEQKGSIDCWGDDVGGFVLADHELMLRLLCNLIQESSVLSDDIPYIRCSKPQKGEMDLVIASSKRRAQDTSHWVLLDESEMNEELDELMQFRAVSLIHAQSVMRAHDALFCVDITNVYDPVYKLRLKVA